MTSTEHPEPDGLRGEAVRSHAGVTSLIGVRTDLFAAPPVAHPRLAEAMRAAALGAIELYQGNRLVNALATDRARFVLSLFCLYLHFGDGTQGSQQGLTVTRARDLCARTDLCSPGRTRAILALMQWGGYLATATSADRRERLLVPTEKMLALHRARWQRQLGAAAMVHPDLVPALSLIDHPDFLPGFAARQAEAYLAGERLTDAAPVLRLFVDRDCGILILFAMLVAGQDRGGTFRDIPVSVSALAGRFGVSRPHVARLLADAGKAGLLEHDSRKGTVSLSPELTAGLRDFFQRLFRLNAFYARTVAESISANS